MPKDRGMGCSCVAKFMSMRCGYKGRVSGQTVHYEELPLKPTQGRCESRTLRASVSLTGP